MGEAGDGQANIQPLLMQMGMGQKPRVWALGVQQEPVPLPNGSAVSTKQAGCFPWYLTSWPGVDGFCSSLSKVLWPKARLP